ncbi:MAG TPA: hypothetical protein VLX91_01355 [Candidatus Acidoferrales bacterium]|nr:hypothetical protein [Candidatus Acidoferrales bacterium]
MNRVFWKTIPYVSLIVSTALFLWFAVLTFKNAFWGNWFLSISANLISVLLIYFLYEIIKSKSEKELKKEISGYARSYIDSNMLSILHTLSKMIYGIEGGRSLGETMRLPRLDTETLRNLLEGRKFLGFQLFKSWSYTHDYFSKVIENNFVMSRLNDEQILIVLKIKNSLYQIEDFFSNGDNFSVTEEIATGYRVVVGASLNPENRQFPNRFLLMRGLNNEKYVVEDFGDFRADDLDRLLQTFMMKRETLNLAVDRVFNLLSLIQKWLELTGNELRLN